jgi:hypothetical protein
MTCCNAYNDDDDDNNDRPKSNSNIIIIKLNSLFINVLKSTAKASYRLSTNNKQKQ